MKKIGILLAALALAVLCIVLLPAEAQAAEIVDSGTCGDNLTWTLDDAGVLTISGTGTMADYSSYSPAPWRSHSSPILSAVIEDGVTDIGSRAFYDCSSLTSITIPDGVTSIGDSAFAYCSSLTDITIPDGVTSIGEGAFDYCSSLTSVTIPDGVTSIEYSAFYGCSNLTNITIPDSVIYILDRAFDGCSSLTSVAIPDGVTTIGEGAFLRCSSLTSVTIPDSVTTISRFAFGGCSNLTGIQVTANNPAFSSDQYGIVYDKNKTDLLHAPGAITSCVIPDSVTTIGESAFYSCSSLTNITIPDSVTTIGISAFSDCTNLISITIPDSVTTIGVFAFYGCSSLTNITIPDSVTVIDDYAFYDCRNLTDVYYGGSEVHWNLLSIGSDNDFLDNATIHFADAPCPDADNDHCCDICGAYLLIDSGNCGENLTWTLDNAGVLTISGMGTMEDYSSYDSPAPWYSYSSSILSAVVEDGVTGIGSYAFHDCSSLTSITIPDSVTSIGAAVFYDCSSLTSVTIPDSVTTISRFAFGYCSSLTNITIPDSVTTIGSYVFEVCSSLTSVTIPDGVTYIGFRTFADCSSLTSITIPDSVTNISGSAFSGCSSLTSITIPDGVTYIGRYAFSECSSLTSVAIPDGVTSIDEGAFYNCGNLTSVIYCGTEDQWNSISIDYYNDRLIDATRQYHDFQTPTVTKEPTYTAMGEQVCTCEYCDEEIVETIPAKFYGTSVALGNTLDMYFGFYTGLVDENGTVKFVREFADGTTETTEAPITSFNKNNSVYDITYTGLAAKEMCDTIHIYVYNGDGELVGQHSDSIRSYVLRQLREKDYGKEFRTLCIDLLNYGAAAQNAFTYGTDDLANKDLTADELKEGTQKVAAYADRQTISGTVESYYGTAYLLEEKISMTMAVRTTYLDNGCYALISYTDHTGKEKTDIRVNGVKNNSVYEFIFNEIVVADGRCLLSIEFYKADGTLVVTVQESMESYTARMAADYPLAEKMLAFSDSAYNYLHRNDE